MLASNDVRAKVVNGCVEGDVAVQHRLHKVVARETHWKNLERQQRQEGCCGGRQEWHQEEIHSRME